jgi:hypothetical protein
MIISAITKYLVWELHQLSHMERMPWIE